MTDREQLYLAALVHHAPSSVQQAVGIDLVNLERHTVILKKADQLASAGAGISLGTQNFVASPFEFLKKHKGQNETPSYRFPFSALSLNDDFFPKKETPKGSVEALWKKFEKEAAKLQQTGRAKAETVLHLLHKYTTTIPNPTAIHSEVSWYDYAKMKAGLAVCLYDIAQSDNKHTDTPIAIIRADISGIQDFIYDIASKSASKNLKGRSFYVQLLADTVLQLMLNEFKLYQGNVMYASGGNFFVIAPNTQEVRDAFKPENKDSFEYKITKALFDEHKTRIAVVMGYKTVSEAQILDGEIDSAITSLFEDKIDRNKKRKFSGLIANDYDSFFNEKSGDDGGEQTLDSITGEEIKGDPEYFLETATKEEPVKESTYKQVEIGKQLKNIKYWWSSEVPLTTDEKLVKKYEVVPLATFERPIYHYLLPEKEFAKLDKSKAQKITTINNANLYTHPTAELGFTIYGGNDVPTFPCDYTDEEEKYENGNAVVYKKGDPKTFNHLVLRLNENCEHDGSFKRLGVLRMDIDGLGNIFKYHIPYPKYEGKGKEGKKRPHLSFAYYAALSRNLDWFFKGYLNTLWAKSADFKDNSQIIYSGGDDLFIVGRWDVMIEFAKEIKNEFARFTCKLPKDRQVSISGGMSIVTHKFPIMKAAAFAGDAEHAAKAHKLETDESKKANKNPPSYHFNKNSFALLGKPLHWETEYRFVEALKNDLVRHVAPNNDSSKGIPVSLLGKIRKHYLMMKEYEKQKYDGKKANPRWIWHVVYDFSRFEQRQKDKYKGFIKKIKDQTAKSNEEYHKELHKKIKEQTTESHEKYHKEIQQAKREAKLLKNLRGGIFTNSYKNEAGDDIPICIVSHYHFLELLYFAARWAELEIRK